MRVSLHIDRAATRWFLGLILLTAGCDTEEETPAGFTFPRPDEWIDRGIALSAGPPGSWDLRTSGMISPAAVIRREGLYFLYYVAADGDRSTDGGPRHRALGVATSPDGIEFEKYSGNPILRHLPNQNEEEGIYSAAAVVGEDQRIWLYYSALDAETPTSESVDSDVRLAVSTDGFRFEDRGDVLSHGDREVWGYGDELFPVGAFRVSSSWNLYYIAKGVKGIYWDLGLATGPAPEALTKTRQVRKTDRDLIGGCSPVSLGGNQFALFLLWGFDEKILEAYVLPGEEPARLGPVQESYRFDARNSVLYLDPERESWFLYSREGESEDIRVRTAPTRQVPLAG